MSAPARGAPPLRLGTRGSPLALRQAEIVRAGIEEACEVVVLRTGGDEGAGSDKRRWVDTIEAALLSGKIDLAVHSAKDVPGELAAGLAIAGAPPREDPRDALCGAASLAALGAGARVGTSSLRRAAQLRSLREDLVVTALGGNVDTRLGRLAAGDFDAIVLAAAGLLRLGRSGWAPIEELVPAAGQGALALQVRTGDEETAASVRAIGESVAFAELRAERACFTR
ncbi:MAG: hydroxymethylbilane synthase, partial [Solirubrobacteraceae bacterium]